PANLSASNESDRTDERRRNVAATTNTMVDPHELAPTHTHWAIWRAWTSHRRKSKSTCTARVTRRPQCESHTYRQAYPCSLMTSQRANRTTSAHFSFYVRL